MTPEEFYGNDYWTLLAAQHQMDELAERLASETGADDDLKAVVYHTSRIKAPESLAAKLAAKGAPEVAAGRGLAAALEAGIGDVLGLRVVCAFSDDVRAAEAWFDAQPGMEVLLRKDYYADPKPSGYRSLHLIVRLAEGPASALPAVEVQLRTIAMDFWSTLEHKMHYKKSIRNEPLMRGELKRCADEIASLDLSMQAIRNTIHKAE